MEKTTVELLLDSKPQARTIVHVTPTTTLVEAARKMREKNIGLLIVLERNKLVGVVSERDIVQRWVANPEFPKAKTVNDVMSTDIEHVTALDTIFDCYSRFVSRKCRHLPVLDPTGNILGVLSLRDVGDCVVEMLRSEMLRSEMQRSKSGL